MEKNQYTCIGPTGQRITFTSGGDIGRAVARLAILALDPAAAPNVPDHVQIAGSVVSYEDVRDLVAKIKGIEKGEIHSEDIAQHKNSLPEEREKPGSVLHYIRYVFRLAATQEGRTYQDIFVFAVEACSWEKTSLTFQGKTQTSS